VSAFVSESLIEQEIGSGLHRISGDSLIVAYHPCLPLGVVAIVGFGFIVSGLLVCLVFNFFIFFLSYLVVVLW